MPIPQYTQDFFLGIPYAQPPVGSCRLAAPQPLRESFGKPQMLLWLDVHQIRLRYGEPRQLG